MQIQLGENFFEAKKGQVAPLYWDTKRLINGHMLVVGSSGVGKSHTIRKMIRRALKHMGAAKVRFHVFDVHGDLDIAGASVVQYSESAPFGLNPLRVNPDPDFGGVRKCIQTFLRTINQSSVTPLGVKQEAVISNLLIDVYREFGFDIDDAQTWGLNGAQTRLAGGGNDNRLYLDVPMAEKDEAKGFGARWDGDKKLWWVHTEKYEGGICKWKPAYKARTYPTVNDVLEYAKRVHLERFLGSDQKAVLALSNLSRKAQAFRRKVLSMVKMQNWHGEAMRSEEKEILEAAGDEAIEAFTLAVKNMQTGMELESLIKYDSPEVLKSVVDRLNNLKRTGIFKDSVAPFDENKAVWRYKLNALSQEEKKMLVLFTLQDIFTRAVQRGECSDVVEVVVLDELGTYTSASDSDNGDGIIGTICREARKFGLAFWGATQSPASVPESLISSTATKILLGLDEMYWRAAVDKLRIELKLLEWVQAQVTMAVQMKEKGVLKNRWHWVQLEDD
jgi:glutaredoxin-related protein